MNIGQFIVRIAMYMLTVTIGQHEIKERADHGSVVIGDTVYTWGG